MVAGMSSLTLSWFSLRGAPHHQPPFHPHDLSEGQMEPDFSISLTFLISFKFTTVTSYPTLLTTDHATSIPDLKKPGIVFYFLRFLLLRYYVYHVPLSKLSMWIQKKKENKTIMRHIEPEVMRSVTAKRHQVDTARSIPLFYSTVLSKSVKSFSQI